MSSNKPSLSSFTDRSSVDSSDNNTFDQDDVFFFQYSGYAEKQTKILAHFYKKRWLILKGGLNPELSYGSMIKGRYTTRAITTETRCDRIERDKVQITWPSDKPWLFKFPTARKRDLWARRLRDTIELLQWLESYTIDTVFGRGGTGIVCLVTNIQQNEQYAMKIIPTKDRKSTQAARAEVRFHSSVSDCINTTRCVDSFRMTSHQMLVMDYCAKGTLEDYLSSRPIPLNETQVIEIMIRIIGAVESMHRLRFIHMDIKTSNILIHETGQMYLSDFGSTKCLDDLSYHRESITTPEFTAPEVLDPDLTFSCQADVYSLGVVLFALLTNGDLPSVKTQEFNLDGYSNEIQNIMKDMLDLNADSRVPLPQVSKRLTKLRL